MIHKTVDKYGGEKVFLVEKDRVGLALLTKAVGSNAIDNITHTYKHPEGKTQTHTHTHTHTHTQTSLN